MELGEEPAVSTAAKLAQEMAYQNKNFLQAGLIVAGWDRHDGGSVYAIPLGGTLVKVPFTIGGSGSAYIYGLCDKLWRVRAAEQAAAGLLAGWCRPVHAAPRT
jgi:20S proteasome subunit beta 1